MRHPDSRALLLVLPLLLAACRDASPVAYRIPKEPDASAADPAVASAHAAMPTVTSPSSSANAVAGAPGLAWTAPVAWQSQPASAMRKATYTIAGPGGTAAELVISAFPGDVGGELANVNRWRGQLGLEPIAASELSAALIRTEHDGLSVASVDLAASASGQRMLAAMVPFGGATWFFKLTGPDAAVAAAKADFTAFLQTIHPVAAAESAAPAPGEAPFAAAPAAGDMSATAVVKAEGADLRWTAPPEWKSQPASAMRKASYAVEGEGGAIADVSITAFPGDVGGELANINRWRNQLQLPPVTAAELDGVVTRRSVSSLAVTIADFSGAGSASGQRLLGAIVPFGGATWFFKLTGPEALVAREKDAFLAFAGTLKTP